MGENRIVTAQVHPENEDSKMPIIHMWQPRVEIEHYSIANFKGLLHSKRCSTELPLRVGLIHAAKMYEYLISLCSAYEPCP